MQLSENPVFFLFDEPLSNLDASLRIQMRIEISRLHKSLDCTTIYVTHDQTEAMTLADKIVVLNQGKVEQVGTPMSLYNRPANIFVATFIGAPHMNLIKKNVTRQTQELFSFKLDGLEHQLSLKFPTPLQTIHLGIRPEHIVLDNEKNRQQFVVNINIEH